MKTKIRVTFLAGIIFASLTSCDAVVFETPVPEDSKPLAIIPEIFWDTYDFSGATNNISTLEITSAYMRADDQVWYISDSMEVKKLGQDLVVNMKFRDKPLMGRHWTALVISPPKSGMLSVHYIGSGLRTQDVEQGVPPPIAANFGARMVSTDKTDPVVYVLRAHAEKLREILADDRITTTVAGRKIDAKKIAR